MYCHSVRYVRQHISASGMRIQLWQISLNSVGLRIRGHSSHSPSSRVYLVLTPRQTVRRVNSSATLSSSTMPTTEPSQLSARSLENSLLRKSQLARMSSRLCSSILPLMVRKAGICSVKQATSTLARLSTCSHK